MGADLSEKPSREEVVAATEAVVPALEILDTRILRKDPATGALRVVTGHHRRQRGQCRDRHGTATPPAR